MIKGSIKKNLSLQTAYQILNTILPLITAPYLARVLGAEQLGVFSFTSSIVSYFTLAAMMGTVNYGTRSIAAVREDRQARSEVFWSIYALQAFVTAIALFGYLVYYFLFCRDNKTIALIQGIALFSCFLDINWLYFGVENFQVTVTRSIIIRILTVASILLFVKSEGDLWLYTLLMLGGTFISQTVLWFRMRGIVGFVRPSKASVLRHVRPNLVLFIPLLAMSVYHAMDKTMLGALSTYQQSGLYYNADKVVNIPLCVLTGFGTVMLPRLTSLIKSGKRAQADRLMMVSLNGVTFLSVAMSFGIAGIARIFVPFFFGKGYDECILLTSVLSSVIIVKGLSNTIRTQYLVPLEQEKVITQSVFAGAAVNLVINYLLIPKHGAMGAVIGTLAAELIACAWQFMFVRKRLPLGRLYLDGMVYAVFGIIMYLIIQLLSGLRLYPTVLKLAVEVVAGGGFYAAAVLAYWRMTQNQFIKIIFGRGRLFARANRLPRARQ